MVLDKAIDIMWMNNGVLKYNIIIGLNVVVYGKNRRNVSTCICIASPCKSTRHYNFLCSMFSAANNWIFKHWFSFLFKLTKGFQFDCYTILGTLILITDNSVPDQNIGPTSSISVRIPPIFIDYWFFLRLSQQCIVCFL